MALHGNNDPKPSVSDGNVGFHWFISGNNVGWVHTHGMEEFGLPELEIRDCPAFLAESAVHLMRSVCDYMHTTGKAVRAGDNMRITDRTTFTFAIPEPMPGSDDHYKVERLQIVDIDQQSCDGDLELRSEMETNLLDDPDEACLD